MKCVSSNGMQLNHIRCIHNDVCNLLLNSHESLRTTIAQYSKLLPPWQRQKFHTLDYVHDIHKSSDNAGKLVSSGISQWLCLNSTENL